MGGSARIESPGAQHASYRGGEGGGGGGGKRDTSDFGMI